MNILGFFIIFALALTVSSLQKNQRLSSTSDSHNIGYLYDAYFEESEIFYCNSDKSVFGYMSLEKGQEQLSISLRSDEQIVGIDRNNVKITDNNKFIKQFDIKGKVLTIRDTYKDEDFERILKLRYVSHSSEAVLTDKDLRLYDLNIKKKSFSERKILLQENEGEKLIDFLALKDKNQDYFKVLGFIVLVIKQIGSQKIFCLKQTNLEKEIREQCLKYPKSFEDGALPQLFQSYSSFYVSFPEKSLIFTQELQFKSEIDTSIKKAHQEFMFLANGKSLSSDKDAIQQSQVVFSQPYFINTMMKVNENQLIFTRNQNQNEEIIGKMKKLDSKEPYQAWIRLPIAEDFSGKNVGKEDKFSSAEVLIQYRNKDLQFVIFEDQKPQVKWVKRAQKIL